MKQTKQEIIIKLVRKSPQYQKWRQQVLKSQNYQCQMCGAKKNLHVHHIVLLSSSIYNYFKLHKQKYINFTETLNDIINSAELWDVNNGEVLCHMCHSLKHPKNINLLFGV